MKEEPYLGIWSAVIFFKYKWDKARPDQTVWVIYVILSSSNTSKASAFLHRGVANYGSHSFSTVSYYKLIVTYQFPKATVCKTLMIEEKQCFSKYWISIKWYIFLTLFGQRCLISFAYWVMYYPSGWTWATYGIRCSSGYASLV